MWDKIMDWLVTNQAWLVPAVAAWIAERFEALSREHKALIRTLVRAVDNPSRGKAGVRGTPEGRSLLLAESLDVVSPVHMTPGELPISTPRVSKARKIGTALLKIIPGLSRFWLPGVK